MKKEPEKKVVSLPAELYDRIEERIREAEFGSVEEYIVFALEEVVKEGGEDEGSVFSKEDEKEIKKRLKALGYLD